MDKTHVVFYFRSYGHNCLESLSGFGQAPYVFLCDSPDKICVLGSAPFDVEEGPLDMDAPEFRALVSLMLVLLVTGTMFYVLHEGWSIVDALYFCVMTMSTVGYGDLTPTSSLSKIFTIVYSLITIGVFVGVVTKLAHAMLVRTHHSHMKP